MDFPNELVTADELTRYLKTSRSTIKRMMKLKLLPGYLVGTRGVRFDRRQVLEALAIGKDD